MPWGTWWVVWGYTIMSGKGDWWNHLIRNENPFVLNILQYTHSIPPVHSIYLSDVRNSPRCARVTHPVYHDIPPVYYYSTPSGVLRISPDVLMVSLNELKVLRCTADPSVLNTYYTRWPSIGKVLLFLKTTDWLTGLMIISKAENKVITFRKNAVLICKIDTTFFSN